LKKWTDLRGIVEKEEGANRELPEGFIPGGFVFEGFIPGGFVTELQIS